MRARAAQAMERMPLLQQVILAALLLEARYSGVPACAVAAVHGRAANAWKTRPSAPPAAAPGASCSSYTSGVTLPLPPDVFFRALGQLRAADLVAVARPELRWAARVTLNVMAEDVMHVCQNSKRLAWMHSMLSAAA
jgi:hypothetical protein